MMKKLFPVIIILLMLSWGVSFGKDTDGLKVFVRTDKLNFYSNEEISLHITVKNTSRKKISFNIFDDSGLKDIYGISRGDSRDFITFRPVVYDMNGRNAELIVPYIQRSEKMSEQLKWMDKRVIILGPGESFVHTQKLDRIYRLDPDKQYRVRLNFFPFLDDKRDGVILSSNEIVFYHKHEKRFMKGFDKPVVENMLMPSEVIVLLLNSERDRNWKRAIKYIDVDRFINSYPAFRRKFLAADDYDKKRVRLDFIRYFTTQRRDALLDFKVVGESINDSGTEAMVEVVALRKSVVSPDRFRYKYRLIKNRKDDFLWTVAGLEASVMKGVIK